MTVADALRMARRTLAGAGSDTPRLDSMVLMAHTLGIAKDRLWGIDDAPLEAESREAFFLRVRERAAGVPVAYLVGEKEFYGRRFAVDPSVLIPRPDTEVLVEEALRLLDAAPELRRVHEVGAGSGCVAITLKLEKPDCLVTASDISHEAGRVFVRNASALGADVPFCVTSLLDGVPAGIDLIVANLPYLTTAEVDGGTLCEAGEPRPALDGGKDGTDIIFALIDAAPRALSPRGFLAVEIGAAQEGTVAARLNHRSYTAVAARRDLAGRVRVLSAGRPVSPVGVSDI